jgi:hypothetical protein
MRTSEAGKGHPTSEHIHPMFIVRVAGLDVGERLWMADHSCSEFELADEEGRLF